MNNGSPETVDADGVFRPLDQGRIAGLGSFVTFLDGLLKNQISWII